MLKRLVVAGCMGLGLIWGSQNASAQIIISRAFLPEEEKVTIKIPLLHPINIAKIHERAQAGHPIKGEYFEETTDWEIGNEEVHYAVAIETSEVSSSPCSQLLIIAPGEITADFQNHLLLKACPILLKENKNEIELFIRGLQIFLTSWE